MYMLIQVSNHLLFNIYMYSAGKFQIISFLNIHMYSAGNLNSNSLHLFEFLESFLIYK